MINKVKTIKRPVWELWLIIIVAHLLGFYAASSYEEVLAAGYEFGNLVGHWLKVFGGPAVLASAATIYKNKKTKD